MDTILQWIHDNLALALIGAVTLIQITPIQINPWSWLMELIRKGLGIDDLKKEIDSLKKEVQQDRADTQQNQVDVMRWNILGFGNSCRNQRKHSKDEWHHVIDQIKKYETYCEKNGIENGVIEEESSYLRSLYKDRLTNNDFLS